MFPFEGTNLALKRAFAAFLPVVTAVFFMRIIDYVVPVVLCTICFSAKEFEITYEIPRYRTEL